MTDKTLVSTPDPDWWKDVFTEAEYRKLDQRLEDVAADETEKLGEMEEPLAIMVPVKLSEFEETFYQVYLNVLDGDEHLTMFGYALAHEYIMNDEIEPSRELASAYHYFATGEMVDLDEEDDDEDD